MQFDEVRCPKHLYSGFSAPLHINLRSGIAGSRRDRYAEEIIRPRPTNDHGKSYTQVPALITIKKRERQKI